MVDVFISYQSERRKAAAHFAKILECYGYTVWYDYSLVKGRDFAAQIDAKIRESKAVIVLWCSKSVRSEWVAAEAALAAKLDTLVPAKIEPCELRVDFREKDYIDLTGWGGAAPRPRARFAPYCAGAEDWACASTEFQGDVPSMRRFGGVSVRLR